MLPSLLLAAFVVPAAAADRRAEPPRIELPSMNISAPTNSPLAASFGLQTPSLPAAPLGAQPSAPIPPLPAAAAAEANAPLPAPGTAEAPLSAAPAASATPQAAPAPAAANAEPEATGFAAKVGRILSKIVNPFGGDKKPEDVSPAVAERRASYAKAMAVDHWSAIKPELQRDLTLLRAMKDTKQKQEFLRQIAAQVVDRLKERHGATELGFHFNLHGGTADGYVDGNGIHATMGDIALNYTMNGDRNLKVYFFRSSRYNLYDVLNQSNPAQLVFPSRMGNVFMAFRVDAAALERGKADGGVLREDTISMDFNTAKLRGVPYEAFAVPPSEPFRVPKALGLGKLSRDEETLAAMRYIEALGTSPGTPLAR